MVCSNPASSGEPPASHDHFNHALTYKQLENEHRLNILVSTHYAGVGVIVVPYELYELYDWGKVPELYGTL